MDCASVQLLFRVLFNRTLLPDMINVFAKLLEQVPFSMVRKCWTEASLFSQTLVHVIAKLIEQVPFSMVRKCGAQASLFSQTLVHGNGKNEIRHRNRGRRCDNNSEHGKKHSRQKKILSQWPNSSSCLLSPRVTTLQSSGWIPRAVSAST